MATIIISITANIVVFVRIVIVVLAGAWVTIIIHISVGAGVIGAVGGTICIHIVAPIAAVANVLFVRVCALRVATVVVIDVALAFYYCPAWGGRPIRNNILNQNRSTHRNAAVVVSVASAVVIEACVITVAARRQ